MTYNNQNIFAKILRGEIPNDTVYEDDYVLAFRDIAPQAPIHILVIPKGEYINIADFNTTAPDALVKGFYKAIATIVAQEGLEDTGFRCITNTGTHGGQEVPHYHMHILGGKPIGPMVNNA